MPVQLVFGSSERRNWCGQIESLTVFWLVPQCKLEPVLLYEIFDRRIRRLVIRLDL